MEQSQNLLILLSLQSCAVGVSGYRFSVVDGHVNLAEPMQWMRLWKLHVS
jgi:hypothetical protein